MKSMMVETNLQLRPFQNRDYPAFVELHNRVESDSPTTVRELRHFFEMHEDEFLLIDVLDGAVKGDLVAVLFARRDPMGEGQIRFDIYLEPSQTTLSLQELLYASLLEKVEPHKPKALTISIREDWQAWMGFYEAKGFEEIERQWDSRLNLETFDPSAFAWASEKAARAGISFKTLADLPDTEATQRLIYTEITQVLLPDVPFSEPLTIWPFETWLKRAWRNPHRDFAGTFLAFVGEELVGISELFSTDDPSKFTTGLTAVKRPYRRKGIAQALKLKAANYASSRGGKEIATSNHSNNRPMLAINEAMGFVKLPAWVRFRKRLGDL